MTSWKLEQTETFQKQFLNLSKKNPPIALRIARKINAIAQFDNPASSMKRLSGPLKDFHRLRVGDYRVVMQVDSGKVVLVAVALGHRKVIYSSKIRA